MAATKVLTLLTDALGDGNVTMTAGAGDWTTTSDVAVLTDGYGAGVYIKITNGTAPTVGGQAKIQVSADNTNWYDFTGPLLAGIGASTEYSWGAIDIPPSVQYLKVIAGSNTGNDVTLRVEIVEVTAVR